MHFVGQGMEDARAKSPSSGFSKSIHACNSLIILVSEFCILASAAASSVFAAAPWNAFCYGT